MKKISHRGHRGHRVFLFFSVAKKQGDQHEKFWNHTHFIFVYQPFVAGTHRGAA
jgi:hypothetical protein